MTRVVNDADALKTLVSDRTVAVPDTEGNIVVIALKRTHTRDVVAGLTGTGDGPLNLPERTYTAEEVLEHAKRLVPESDAGGP